MVRSWLTPESQGSPRLSGWKRDGLIGSKVQGERMDRNSVQQDMLHAHLPKGSLKATLIILA